MFRQAWASGLPVAQGHCTGRRVKRWFTAIVLLVTALIAVGCHAGYAYDEVRVDLPVAGTDSIAVATLDHREAVTQQGRSPEFVGVLQESAGSTRTVTTKSGDALALDISAVISRSLEQSGFSVERVALEPRSTVDQAFDRLKSTGKKHLLLLVIKRWESETDKNTELYFDLTLRVENVAGALQGESEARGTDQFAPRGSSSFEEVESVLTDALGRKLSILFSQPKIQEAFRRTY